MSSSTPSSDTRSMDSRITDGLITVFGSEEFSWDSPKILLAHDYRVLANALLVANKYNREDAIKEISELVDRHWPALMGKGPFASHNTTPFPSIEDFRNGLPSSPGYKTQFPPLYFANSGAASYAPYNSGTGPAAQQWGTQSVPVDLTADEKPAVGDFGRSTSYSSSPEVSLSEMRRRGGDGDSGSGSAGDREMR